MGFESLRARQLARTLYYVDPASGRIHPSTTDDRDLIDAARRLEKSLGRTGHDYRVHARNPDPGRARGYYVYEDPGEHAGDPDELGIADWVVVAFVEIVEETPAA